MDINKQWRKIRCSQTELRLNITLDCGQSFRWKECSPGCWTSVLSGHVWSLKQDDQFIYYRIHNTTDSLHHQPTEAGDSTTPHQTSHHDSCPDPTPQNPEPVSPTSCPYGTILSDYFQLDVNLAQLYSKWCKTDANFASKAHRLPGVRMLRQDPVENLFSFICSSNNHISRISGMVEKLCENYGACLLELDGVKYHSFPQIQSLAGPQVESRLRELGFGYRAKYIVDTARYIERQGKQNWLMSLRHKTYDEAKSELLKLSGVGPKVADCVLLMSLDKPGSVPVDTHVWQIITRDYPSAGINPGKSLSNTVYNQIGAYFRDIWGEYAGWAQSVVFSADLKKFQDKDSPQKVSQKRKSPKVKEKNTTKKKKSKK